MKFTQATVQGADEIMKASAEAFITYKKIPTEQKAIFLESIANEIDH